MRVLISGYIINSGKLGAAHHYLAKPFKAAEILPRIRCALEAQERIENSNLGRVVQLRRGRQSVDRFCWNPDYTGTPCLQCKASKLNLNFTAGRGAFGSSQPLVRKQLSTVDS